MTMQGGADTTELLATVGFKWLGSGDIGNAPGGAVDPRQVSQKADDKRNEAEEIKRSKAMKDAMLKRVEQGKNHLRSTFGINIGIASILKQSQIFTGTLGTIFQILGALVDVILAPFLPIIVPALKLMAKNIPQIKEKADQMVGAIMRVFHWLKDKLTGVGDFFSKNKFGKILRDVFQYFLIGMFLTRLLGAHKLLMVAVKFLAIPIIALGKLLLAPLIRLVFRGETKIPNEVANMQANLQTARNTTVIAMRGGMGGAGGTGMMTTGPLKTTKGGMLARMGGGMGALAIAGGVGIAGYSVYNAQKEGWGAGAGGGAIGGAVIGAALGAVLGGPIGASIGLAIGAAAGPIIGEHIEGFFLRTPDRHKDIEAFRPDHDRMIYEDPSTYGGYSESFYDARGRFRGTKKKVVAAVPETRTGYGN